MMSAVFLLVQLLVSFFCSGGVSPLHVNCILLVSCMLLWLSHRAYERPVFHCVLSVLLGMVSLLVLVFDFSPMLIFVQGIISCLAVVVLEYPNLHSVVRLGEGDEFLWRLYDSYCSVLLLLPTLIGCLVFMNVPDGNALGWLLLLPFSALYALLYHRELQGMDPVLLRNPIRVQTPPPKKDQSQLQVPTTTEDNDANLKDEKKYSAGLYEVVLNKMWEGKLFLDPKLDKKKLAKECGTNQTYLSTAVNRNSGFTIPSLINWFRVEYARSLIEANSELRMRDVAEQSGFLTHANFDVKFKEQTGMSPIEYHQSVHDKLIPREKCPSSSMARERQCRPPLSGRGE